jgi:hypothetical protein
MKHVRRARACSLTFCRRPGRGESGLGKPEISWPRKGTKGTKEENSLYVFCVFLCGKSALASARLFPSRSGPIESTQVVDFHDYFSYFHSFFEPYRTASPTQSNPVQPGQAQSNRVKPSPTGSSPVRPGQAQSNRVKPSPTGSNPVQPGQTQSNRVKPSPAGSNPVQPGQTQSNRVKPSPAGSSPVQPGQTQSNRVKPSPTGSNCGRRRGRDAIRAVDNGSGFWR